MNMNLKKGDKLHFISRDEIELVLSHSNGEVSTEGKKYSSHFINTWNEFGFLKIIKKQNENTRKQN